jgi:hypothetical protein
MLLVFHNPVSNSGFTSARLRRGRSGCIGSAESPTRSGRGARGRRIPRSGIRLFVSVIGCSSICEVMVDTPEPKRLD